MQLRPFQRFTKYLAYLDKQSVDTFTRSEGTIKQEPGCREGLNGSNLRPPAKQNILTLGRIGKRETFFPYLVILTQPKLLHKWNLFLLKNNNAI